MNAEAKKRLAGRYGARAYADLADAQNCDAVGQFCEGSSKGSIQRSVWLFRCLTGCRCTDYKPSLIADAAQLLNPNDCDEVDRPVDVGEGLGGFAELLDHERNVEQ